MTIPTACHGLLNIYKPVGLTSRDVVDRVQRLVRPQKVGHAGTLDPLASGVLVIGVGTATRLIEYVQQAKKRYVGAFRLGVSSPTEDLEGELIPVVDAPQPTQLEVEAAAARFVGQIEQRPPAYSALKVDGQRAYARARRGETVDIAPRPVIVHSLKLLDYAYPDVRLEIECSAGTYVRSLGRDLGAALGSAAVMTALERTAVGAFTVAEATLIDRLTIERLPGLLHPLLKAVDHLPTWRLSADELQRLCRGLSLERRDGPTASEVAACDESGQLWAILKQRSDGRWGPAKNVAPDGVYS